MSTTSASRRSASYTSLARNGSYASNNQQQQALSRTYTRTISTRYQPVQPARYQQASRQQQQQQHVESNVERAILDSSNPLPVHNGEEMVVNNQRVVLLNKDENVNFRGPIPLDQYEINADPNPLVVRKKPTDKIKYRQDVIIKYLKPPTPKPSELIIVQEAPRQLPAAPPLVVRQQRQQRAVTPAPIIYREQPPPPPPPAERKVVYLRAPTPKPKQSCPAPKPCCCPPPPPSPKPCCCPPPPPPPKPEPCYCPRAATPPPPPAPPAPVQYFSVRPAVCDYHQVLQSQYDYQVVNEPAPVSNYEQPQQSYQLPSNDFYQPQSFNDNNQYDVNTQYY